MKRKTSNTKPMIDVVNDAVSALSDLVSSLRGRTHGSSRVGPDIKTKAKAAAAEVKEGAHEISDEVRRAGHSLRAHFEQAWEALTTSNGKNGDAPRRTAAKAAAPKGGARRSTARRPRAARRTPSPHVA